MKVLKDKKETYKEKGKIEKTIRVTELIQDENGELNIVTDGKPRRVFNFTLNANDRHDYDLLNWIFDQKDLSTSIKKAIKFYIKNA